MMYGEDGLGILAGDKRLSPGGAGSGSEAEQRAEAAAATASRLEQEKKELHEHLAMMVLSSEQRKEDKLKKESRTNDRYLS